ncbi:DUF3500 domain-containing protein [Allorhodopirellula heiligendammensis]|uniref:DUF3500 domain-containing protein n=1 Tax=Allorhodopirellula heiligendammensis TaxID=2714739 RepID=A0A5C6BG16_9BACT|nr:DUF3500 domain-containing protein [Allorhodopirellula heiligendammensis]TWU10890.1 hypothetical protein Poly21_47960 [Allorhodopirellula heiligendammensis]
MKFARFPKSFAAHSRRAGLLAVGLLAVGATGLDLQQSPATQMQAYAYAYLDTLDDGQRQATLQEFDSPTRVGWHFIPKDTRKGLKIEDMNDAQRTAALRLVRAALSEAGYRKANQIMLLEEVLNELEQGKGGNERNPLKYFVTMFGTPGKADAIDGDNRWGLSFEGHHLSLNFVCRGNEMLDSTPQFMGANPAVVMDETNVTLGKGTAVLSREEQLGFKLINSLSDEQKEVAMFADKAPQEIRFAGEAQPTPGPAQGIAFGKLEPAQQEVMRDLVLTHVNIVADEVAAARREQIKSDGWDDVTFAWAGALKPGVGHAYRITGKRFLIEFNNTQSDPSGNPANHIHCIYRDLTGDFDLPVDSSK